MLERYVNIINFPNYAISNFGNVINLTTHHKKTSRIIKDYHYVDLSYKGKRKNCRLGRLVAIHFILNPLRRPEVNHKDGNKLNDRVENLEWTTDQENKQHARRLNLYPLSKGNMKFTKQKIETIRDLRKQGLTHREIANKLSMGISTVTHVLLGTRRAKQ